MWHRLGLTLATLLGMSLLPGCSGQRYIEVNIDRDGAPPFMPSMAFLTA